MERIKKWQKMVKDWESPSTKEKLRRRVYKGIPDRYRGTVWTLLLGITKLKSEQPGKYAEMLSLARQWSTEIRQIDADVARQYRDHINYRYELHACKKIGIQCGPEKFENNLVSGKDIVSSRGPCSMSWQLTACTTWKWATAKVCLFWLDYSCCTWTKRMHFGDCLSYSQTKSTACMVSRFFKS